MHNKISVFLADDNDEFVGLFSEYLSTQPDIEVVGTAANGWDAYEQIIAHCPDVIMLDIIMPRLDGFGLLRKLKEQKMEKKPSVIILSAVAREEVTREALLLGVDYYIIKPFDLPMLVERIRTFCREKADSEPQSLSYSLPPAREAGRDLELKTTQFLLKIGIPPNIQGFQFLRDCVLLLCSSKEYEDLNSHYFYYTLANQYRTTPICVERAIHYAKNVAFGKNTPEKALLFQSCRRKRKKGMPSNMEMIRAISDSIKR